MNVIEYVTEEVSRQGHDVSSVNGIERVGWMLNGWGYALNVSQAGHLFTVMDVVELGMLIEPIKNVRGIRQCGVRVGTRVCPDFDLVAGLLGDLFAKRDTMPPLGFYRELLEIHPFVDGNGRSGKIVLNWLNGTLLDPVFPPNDFWGYPIRNP